MMVSMPPVIMGSTSTPDIRRRTCRQAAHGRAHLVGPVQVQFDGARVGLVQQAGHVGLDHHVTAQAGRRRDGRVGAARRRSTIGMP